MSVSIECSTFKELSISSHFVSFCPRNDDAFSLGQSLCKEEF